MNDERTAAGAGQGAMGGTRPAIGERAITRNGYTIRPYRPGDEDGILASFNAVFREVCGESYVDRDRATWSWVYEQNPSGARIWVAVAPDGSIAGHYGGLPQLVRGPEGRRVIVHAVDSFVVAAHRQGLERPGMFVRTAEPWFAECETRGDSMVYGYPVTKAMRIGQRYLGYTPMRRLDYLMRAPGGLEAPGGVVVAEVDAVPAELDALCERSLPAHAMGLVRDHGYLDWRYARSPDREGRHYRMLTARRDGALVGFAVAADALLVPDHDALIDVVIPEHETDAFQALVAAIDARAAERGRDGVMTVLPPWWGPTRHLLEHCGFVERSSGEWLERTLSHRSFEPQWTTDWLRDHWFYTLGDSDLA
jgi:hypothetical protein